MSKNAIIGMLIIILVLVSGCSVFMLLRKKKIEKNNTTESILSRVQTKYGFTTDLKGNIKFQDGTTA